jgi:hypothetical protein
VLLSCLAACGGAGKDDTATEPGPTGTGCASHSSTLVFTNSNNYSFTADLSLVQADVGAAADVTVDWSAFTEDFRGRPVIASEVDRVTISAYNIGQDELIAKINTNGVGMEDIRTFGQADPVDATSIPFSAFVTPLGSAWDYQGNFTPGFASTWVLTLWKQNELGTEEILSSKFVVPVADGPTTTTWANGDATLDFAPDLRAPPLCAAADAPPYGLNWASVTTDVFGKPYDAILGTQLRISHFAAGDLADVEDQLLQLDLAAEDTWYGDVFSTTAVDDLSIAATLDGAPFPGFTADGTWLVDIACVDISCFSPAPLILAVVDVE